jgi:hypothetical protein
MPCHYYWIADGADRVSWPDYSLSNRDQVFVGFLPCLPSLHPSILPDSLTNNAPRSLVLWRRLFLRPVLRPPTGQTTSLSHASSTCSFPLPVPIPIPIHPILTIPAALTSIGISQFHNLLPFPRQKEDQPFGPASGSNSVRLGHFRTGLTSFDGRPAPSVPHRLTGPHLTPWPERSFLRCPVPLFAAGSKVMS